MPDKNSQPTPHNSLPKKEIEQLGQEESWWVEALKTIGLSLFLAFGIRTFVAEARYIPSGSMEPTLQINDRLIVDKVSYLFHKPERGDIVVFNPTPTLEQQGFTDAFIKRIVGLPGDTVEVKSGRVFINHRPLREQYISSEIATSIDTCGPDVPAFLAEPKQVPRNSYLVLGDNRNNSYDGRCWGFVPSNDIVGRAAFRFWPLNRTGVLSPPQSQSR